MLCFNDFAKENHIKALLKSTINKNIYTIIKRDKINKTEYLDAFEPLFLFIKNNNAEATYLADQINKLDNESCEFYMKIFHNFIFEKDIVKSQTFFDMIKAYNNISYERFIIEHRQYTKSNRNFKNFLRTNPLFESKMKKNIQKYPVFTINKNKLDFILEYNGNFDIIHLQNYIENANTKKQIKGYQNLIEHLIENKSKNTHKKILDGIQKENTVKAISRHLEKYNNKTFQSKIEHLILQKTQNTHSTEKKRKLIL